MDLLAQADSMKPIAMDWMQVLGPLGVAGILAWFMWYTVSVAGPAKDKEHREALCELEEKHTADMKEMSKENNDTIRAIVGEMREDREKDRQARREDIAAVKSMLPGGRPS